jgi:LysM repeat protein
VKQGDTLGSIATRYRVSVDSLKRGNNIGRFLQVGQKIYIR